MIFFSFATSARTWVFGADEVAVGVVSASACVADSGAASEAFSLSAAQDREALNELLGVVEKSRGRIGRQLLGGAAVVALLSSGAEDGEECRHCVSTAEGCRIRCILLIV